MKNTRKPQGIDVNKQTSQYFGGILALVVSNHYKQAIIADMDWIASELNKDYAEWVEYNHPVILPAKVKEPKVQELS